MNPYVMQILMNPIAAQRERKKERKRERERERERTATKPPLVTKKNGECKRRIQQRSISSKQ